LLSHRQVIDDREVACARGIAGFMLPTMRYGFYSPNFGSTGDPTFLVELATRAEAAGWDGFFLWDHLAVQPPPLVDPWVALGAVAARTDRIVLGPLIVPLARRRPQKAALEAVSLARLAPGRFVLGIGLGAPDDYTRFGEDPAWRTRAAKLDECAALLRRLAAGENVGEADLPVRFLETEVDFPVWASGVWPRRQPVHAIGHADGIFPTVRGEDGRFRPPSPGVVRDLLAELPDRARTDCAIWGWDDRGDSAIEDYEAAGVTWWMVETYGLDVDRLRALADSGPGRLVRSA
jgi:alkanesulfonate monooxygenase SsuD/methylene tetrahydromethanopterin reductase-like flavin-dependent oxidoreductase (luciferase family)